jgi:hypothetical protein
VKPGSFVSTMEVWRRRLKVDQRVAACSVGHGAARLHRRQKVRSGGKSQKKGQPWQLLFGTASLALFNDWSISYRGLAPFNLLTLQQITHFLARSRSTAETPYQRHADSFCILRRCGCAGIMVLTATSRELCLVANISMLCKVHNVRLCEKLRRLVAQCT